MKLQNVTNVFKIKSIKLFMKESKIIRVDIKFYKRLQKYIMEFKHIHNVKMSFEEATSKIDDKIESIGGIVVD
jgi:uncharacterized protein YjaG (DUF416 family)